MTAAPDSWVIDGPLGQGGGRGGQVGPIDVHPAAPDLDQRLGFLGQRGDLGRVELEVVEEHRPPHVGQLLHADLGRAADRLGEQAQLRGGAGGCDTTGQHDVEAGRGQRRPGREHQLDRLVAVEHDLAPAGARPAQHREQPLEPAQLGFDLLGLGARGDHQGVLDGHGVLVHARSPRPTAASRRRTAAGRAGRSGRRGGWR